MLQLTAAYELDIVVQMFYFYASAIVRMVLEANADVF